jgi:1-acyl-sn-glycerol-3-phosphate acyltransferase
VRTAPPGARLRPALGAHLLERGPLPPAVRCVFWAKRSLFRIPFLGSAMRAMGSVPVDREDRTGAGRMLADTRRLLQEGWSVLLFPEQTYGSPGELLPFQRGGFLLALRERLPILPIGIHGSAAALPPRTRLVSPSEVVVRFGTPIATAGLGVSQRERLTETTRRAIEELLGEQQSGDEG